jgi:2-keto-3-deoxy-L-rhamnonate aldolase RhmA
MRKSKVLAKLRKGGFARVCSLGHFLPFFIRHAAHLNFDGIWVDLEHRTMTEREVQALLAFCLYTDIDSIIRPPTLERTPLCRYLEDGATGLMIPFVSDGKIARQVASAVKFPPSGNRGIDGAGLDGDYGLEAWRSVSEYTAETNRQTFILAQIETPEAVDNVEEIAAVPGIDCLFVGPSDLALRLDVLSGSNGMTIEEAVERVARSARQHKKSWGIAPSSLEEITRYHNMGAQIAPWGGDFSLINVLETCMNELDIILRVGPLLDPVEVRESGR